jgi:long-subunit acyl-CoA synthetase (AMP-forming)
MAVRCQVVIEQSGSPIDCMFIAVPRIWERVFMAINGSPDMSMVEAVNHFAQGAVSNSPEASIQLRVSREA